MFISKMSVSSEIWVYVIMLCMFPTHTLKQDSYPGTFKCKAFVKKIAMSFHKFNVYKSIN